MLAFYLIPQAFPRPNAHIDTTATAAFYLKGENGAGNFSNDETVIWLRGTFRFQPPPPLA